VTFSEYTSDLLSNYHFVRVTIPHISCLNIPRLDEFSKNDTEVSQILQNWRAIFFRPFLFETFLKVFQMNVIIKFMFSKKDTKIDEIFTIDLTICSKCQIDDVNFFNFCGLLRKHLFYLNILNQQLSNSKILSQLS
jgi:hypothetical protein